jgi:two-component system chemotaxis response regulator CheY
MPFNAKTRTNEQSPAAALRRVLVADADAATRTRYRLALPLAGCEVIEAGDGREALTKALTELPTLIITELRLPLIDGVALCKILRRDAVTHAVPILVVTAETRPAQLNRIRNAGATAVLVKPTRRDAIVSEVRKLTTNGAHGHSGRGTDAQLNAVVEPNTSGVADSEAHRSVLSKSHARFRTTTPPVPPLTLTCPSCDQLLNYDHSHVGGVNARFSEQWDYYSCSRCGAFQYRHRTRKLRHCRWLDRQAGRRQSAAMAECANRADRATDHPARLLGDNHEASRPGRPIRSEHSIA